MRRTVNIPLAQPQTPGESSRTHQQQPVVNVQSVFVPPSTFSNAAEAVMEPVVDVSQQVKAAISNAVDKAIADYTHIAASNTQANFAAAAAASQNSQQTAPFGGVPPFTVHVSVAPTNPSNPTLVESSNPIAAATRDHRSVVVAPSTTNWQAPIVDLGFRRTSLVVEPQSNEPFAFAADEVRNSHIYSAAETLAPAPTATLYEDCHSRRSAASAKMEKVDRRNHRTSWTTEEEHMLESGVREYGVGHWAKILEKYPFNSVRTSVDLKDKYRNMLKRNKLPATSRRFAPGVGRQGGAAAVAAANASSSFDHSIPVPFDGSTVVGATDHGMSHFDDGTLTKNVRSRNFRIVDVSRIGGNHGSIVFRYSDLPHAWQSVRASLGLRRWEEMLASFREQLSRKISLVDECLSGLPFDVSATGDAHAATNSAAAAAMDDDASAALLHDIDFDGTHDAEAPMAAKIGAESIEDIFHESKNLSEDASSSSDSDESANEERENVRTPPPQQNAAAASNSKLKAASKAKVSRARASSSITGRKLTQAYTQLPTSSSDEESDEDQDQEEDQEDQEDHEEQSVPLATQTPDRSGTQRSRPQPADAGVYPQSAPPAAISKRRLNLPEVALVADESPSQRNAAASRASQSTPTKSPAASLTEQQKEKKTKLESFLKENRSKRLA